jgi:hypothetical protein
MKSSMQWIGLIVEMAFRVIKDKSHFSTTINT